MKSLALLSVVACLAIASFGCGSSSSSTSSTAAGGGGPAGAGPRSGASGAAATTGDADSSNPGSGGGEARSNSGSGERPAESSAGSRESKAPSGGGETNDNGAPLGSDTKKGGDNSIETYGTDVEGPEKAAVLQSMRSFVDAVASHDYAEVCAGLSSRIREGLARPGETCPHLLESLLTISASEARNSANGTVTHVRIGGGNAFVLFLPQGSSRLSYFVMSLEDGSWKALGLTVGTPLEPVAG